MHCFKTMYLCQYWKMHPNKLIFSRYFTHLTSSVNSFHLTKNVANRKNKLEFNNWKTILRKLTVLGIESSCDETGAAVVDSQGKILGEGLNSQLLIHLANGGIMPPLAKDLHRDHIIEVVDTALNQSKLNLNDVDAIATTVKPGMELSLLVGLNYSKYLVRKSGKPFIPIHHMEAHALTVRMVHDVKFPYLVTLVSGGHCQIALVKSVDEFILLGTTLDDSPGEVFDKIARRLKLRNIPEFSKLSGGQAIEKLALRGDPFKFEFSNPMVKFRDCNFSFSGTKGSAVRLIVKEEKKHGIIADGIIPSVADVCASFQQAVVRHIITRIHRAMSFCENNELIPDSNRTLVISGGVASNNYLRGAISILCENTNYDFKCPPPKLCSDNGIMIAWNGMERLLAGKGIVRDVESIDVQPKCSLGVDLTEKVKESSIKIRPIKLDIEKMRQYSR